MTITIMTIMTLKHNSKWVFMDVPYTVLSITFI